MNLFWQITMIEFLLNVAIFSGAIIFYGPVRLLAARSSGGRESIERAATGVLLGIATAVALLLPIHLEGGAVIGCSTILLAIAGPLDGVMAVLGGVVVSVAIEFLPWGEKGSSNYLPTISLLVPALIGLGFRFVLAHLPGKRNMQLHYIHLPFLGMVSAAGSLIVLGLFQGESVVASAILPSMMSNILAALILGTLLLHETGRSLAERKLRESEARLVGQAKELALARDNAEAANRSKSMFLANMSHELRTPLNAILGYAQLLKRDRSLTAWQANASNTIEQSGEHLLTLITDILDLSKIEANKTELHIGPVDLYTFMQGIGDIIRIKAEEKALDFTCDIEPSVPAFVQADQKRLRQVLLNLLSNAVKFTDHGRVNMRVRALSKSEGKVLLHFEVQDTGSGMTADQLGNIFKPFVQVGDERHQVGGTGLGLSIGQQLVGLMGGEIRVESALGKGSCFSFEMSALLVDSAPGKPHTSGQVTGYEGPRKRVLVVDDTAASRSVLAETLGVLGFEVNQAVNGLEALTVAQATRPDLILTDIRMPVMGGLEAIQSMQQIANLRTVPIISCSANVTEEERSRSTAAGAVAFLMKPIDNASMLQEIGKSLSLTWIREDIQRATSSGGDRVEQLVVPEPAQMESLRRLAMAGNMRAIRDKADEIAKLDSKYRPFADKITQLALGYQSKALSRLVEKLAPQNRVDW
jgi:signal transduction histidine kinase/DNA-binding NarL/FixJ family response regulator